MNTQLVDDKPRRPLNEIEADITNNLEGTGYTFVCFGPDSVGVQGDARVVGPTVVLTQPPQGTTEESGRICTNLINKVVGITRVMIDIPLNHS